MDKVKCSGLSFFSYFIHPSKVQSMFEYMIGYFLQVVGFDEVLVALGAIL